MTHDDKSWFFSQAAKPSITSGETHLTSHIHRINTETFAVEDSIDVGWYVTGSEHVGIDCYDGLIYAPLEDPAPNWPCCARLPNSTLLK